MAMPARVKAMTPMKRASVREKVWAIFSDVDGGVCGVVYGFVGWWS